MEECKLYVINNSGGSVQMYDMVNNRIVECSQKELVRRRVDGEWVLEYSGEEVKTDRFKSDRIVEFEGNQFKALSGLLSLCPSKADEQEEITVDMKGRSVLVVINQEVFKSYRKINLKNGKFIIKSGKEGTGNENGIINTENCVVRLESVSVQNGEKWFTCPVRGEVNLIKTKISNEETVNIALNIKRVSVDKLNRANLELVGKIGELVTKDCVGNNDIGVIFINKIRIDSMIVKHCSMWVIIEKCEIGAIHITDSDGVNLRENKLGEYTEISSERGIVQGNKIESVKIVKIKGTDIVSENEVEKISVYNKSEFSKIRTNGKRVVYKGREVRLVEDKEEEERVSNRMSSISNGKGTSIFLLNEEIYE